MTTNSILLENISSDELKNLIEKSVSDAISRISKSAGKTNEVEQPISQPEAIRFLGKSRQTLISWRKKNIISAHKMGGRIFYLKSELLNALK